MYIIKNFHSCFWEQNLLTHAWFKQKAESLRKGSTCVNKKSQEFKYFTWDNLSQTLPVTCRYAAFWMDGLHLRVPATFKHSRVAHAVHYGLGQQTWRVGGFVYQVVLAISGDMLVVWIWKRRDGRNIEMLLSMTQCKGQLFMIRKHMAQNANTKQYMLAYDYNPSTWDVQEKGKAILGYVTSRGNMRLWPKKKMRLWTLATQNVVLGPVYQASLGTGKVRRFLASIPELLNQSLHISKIP